jgi:hypothetical protein
VAERVRGDRCGRDREAFAVIDLDALPFAADAALADLEAERATREDQLDHIRAAFPGSRAIRVLTNYLAEIEQEIAARSLIGA